jgi:hypothetical protein
MFPVVCALLGVALAALPPPPTQVDLTNKRGSVLLDHKAHLDRKARCRACHGDGRVGKIEFTKETAHAACVGCHKEQTGPTGCRECHVWKTPDASSTSIARAEPALASDPATAPTTVSASPAPERARPPSATAGQQAGGAAPPSAKPAPRKGDAEATAQAKAESAPPEATAEVPRRTVEQAKAERAAAEAARRRDLRASPSSDDGGRLWPVPVMLTLSGAVTSTRDFDGERHTAVVPDVAVFARKDQYRIGVAFSTDPFTRAGGTVTRFVARGGYSVPLARRLRVDGLVDAGVQRYELDTGPDLLSDVTSETSAVLPTFGAEAGVAYAVREADAWLSVGAFARSSIMTERGRYTFERCTGAPAACTEGEGAYRFGGASFGLTVTIAAEFDFPWSPRAGR